MELRFSINDTEVHAHRDGSGPIAVTVDGERHDVELVGHGSAVYAVVKEGGRETVHAAADGDAVWVRWRGRTYLLTRERGRRRSGPRGGGGLTAPMPGQVLQHLVAEGAEVEAGEPLLVLEAMKMQLEIKAPHAGRVTRFLAAEGETVTGGAALVDLETTG